MARSDELRGKPIARTLLGIPLAVFRTRDGEVGAVLDRCPHRNVPLSLGRVQGERLECGYHGWQFDTEGVCRKVPALCGNAEGKARRVDAYPATERQGFVWVYGRPEPAARRPFVFPHMNDPDYTTVHQTLDMEGTVHAVAENALDVPHTHFLHRGLFRSEGERNEIEVVVRRWHDRVEAQYIGEPRPEGVIGRVLAPSGGLVEHFDRFLLPSIAQVEYRLGDDAHIIASTALTPLSDFRTRLFGVVSFRLGFLPARLGNVAARVLKPLGLAILKQDARMLERQTDTIRRFGGEHYASTEVDALGPSIMKLLRQAERERPEPVDEPHVRTFRMHV